MPRRKPHVHLGVMVKNSEGQEVPAWIRCDPDLPQTNPKAWEALQRMVELAVQQVEKEKKGEKR